MWSTMVADITPYEALMLAVDRTGSQSALAREVGVSHTAIWKWVQSSKRVPSEFVLRVEEITGVSRHYLRPDIYPLDLAPGPCWAGPLDDTTVIPTPARHNGNRTHVLDAGALRRAAL